MVALVDNQQLSTAGDHPRSNQRVASQTKEPRRETHASSKSQAADAGVADEACVRHEHSRAAQTQNPRENVFKYQKPLAHTSGDSQAVRLKLGINGSPRAAASHGDDNGSQLQ
jgi:hypothetical protein